MVISFKILALLWAANFVPVFLAYIYEEEWNAPVDMGLRFTDKKPLLGPHKTIRGFSGGIAAGTLVGWGLGLPFLAAAGASALSMGGDLFTSFVKRRLDMASGANFPVMDQVFEGAFPFIILVPAFSLSLVHTVILVVAFTITAYGGARFLQGVLLTEPFTGYTRKIRSKIRFREWRACDTIEYPFHPIINFERTLYYHWMMKTVFKLAGLYERGKKNALDVKLRRIEMEFNRLPPGFDGFTLLFISDLHLDCMEGLAKRAVELVKGLKPDLCIMGGDYRTESWGSYSKALEHLKDLLDHIEATHGIYAVLGNHDCLEMVSPLKEKQVTFLVNDARPIEKDGERIWIAGVDDPYYFEGHDLLETFGPIPDQDFTLFAAHTPAIYREAAAYRPDLYLCGHTHAGQIQLPVLGPVITHCKTPRKMAFGRWTYKGMQGYTSAGLGTSGIPVRFNCHGEAVLFTLKKKGEAAACLKSRTDQRPRCP
ncbi:MAG: CDP-archaeol synthase [Desulfobacter sp.]|nr:MAG: CDP-archaeol synthase [Desulfobacter sp.]